MYKLSEAAAEDIENILTRSMLDFGLERTETYVQSLTQCLELLGDNPERQAAVPWMRSAPATAVSCMKATRFFIHHVSRMS